MLAKQNPHERDAHINTIDGEAPPSTNTKKRANGMTQIGRVVSAWISCGRVMDTIIRSMSWSGLRTTRPTGKK